jgi:hypothetical protein
VNSGFDLFEHPARARVSMAEMLTREVENAPVQVLDKRLSYRETFVLIFLLFDDVRDGEEKSLNLAAELLVAFPILLDGL